jgi:hypothetical protein
MTFSCVKIHMSKCNRSRAVSIKRTINFNFQSPPSPIVFLGSRITVLLEVLQPFKLYQQILVKFHDPTLTGASSARTLKF